MKTSVDEDGGGIVPANVRRCQGNRATCDGEELQSALLHGHSAIAAHNLKKGGRSAGMVNDDVIASMAMYVVRVSKITGDEDSGGEQEQKARCILELQNTAELLLAVDEGERASATGRWKGGGDRADRVRACGDAREAHPAAVLMTVTATMLGAPPLLNFREMSDVMADCARSDALVSAVKPAQFRDMLSLPLLGGETFGREIIDYSGREQSSEAQRSTGGALLRLHGGMSRVGSPAVGADAGYGVDGGARVGEWGGRGGGRRRIGACPMSR